MDIINAFNDMHTPIKWSFNNPLFRTSDIGNVLGLSNINATISYFDETERPGSFLTELGLYNILFISQKPIAKQFIKWVYKVIKEIRINGSYVMQQSNNTQTENEFSKHLF